MAKRWCFLISIGLVLILSCSQEEPPLKIDLTKREKVEIRKEAHFITYAYLPQYSHTVSYQRHHLLVEYLQKETGIKIKQIFPDTFDQHMDMVGQRKIDISYSNPFIYVEIARRHGAYAFSRVVEADGQRNFRGQIICRADNAAIKTIEDCRGKRLIAVDPTSAGGYLYPLGLFLNHGLRPEDFMEIAFSPGPGGKQEKVVLAVYAGRYDVGTIREGTLDVVGDRINRNDIRIIANTPWYPGWVYAARKGLDPEVVRKIKKAMLALDYGRKAHRAILEAADIRQIISAVDSDFEPVKQLAVQVGIRLDK